MNKQADDLLRRLVAVIDAASMLWTDPVPGDAMDAIHDAKEYLAVRTQKDSLDVERLARALDALEPHWWDDMSHGAPGWNLAVAIAQIYATSESDE